jgi:hypothetical protein
VAKEMHVHNSRFKARDHIRRKVTGIEASKDGKHVRISHTRVLSAQSGRVCPCRADRCLVVSFSRCWCHRMILRHGCTEPRIFR